MTPDDEREALLKAAAREIDRREEYADAHGHPAFQDEPSAFLNGAEWAAFHRTEVPEHPAIAAVKSMPIEAIREHVAHRRSEEGEPSDARPYSEATDIEYGAWETDDIEEHAQDMLAVVRFRRAAAEAR